jgi:DNA-directed RNA polymerase specialized sigma subunit
MKYDGLRKPQRDNQLIKYAKAHPELSLQEIGDKYGISRSRVSQILNKAGVKR